MQLKLLLKQSFRDFLNKISLYLTFAFFLILTVSVSLGMISFAYSYSNLFNQTLGSNRVNAKIDGLSFLPAAFASDTPKQDAYVAQEKVDQETGTNQGYFFEFLKNLNLEKDGARLTDLELNNLLLGIGYKKGSVANDLTHKDLLQDQTLNEQIGESGLDAYNQNALILRQKLNNLYQTKNVVMAYLLQYLFAHPKNYQIGGERPLFEKNLTIGQEDSIQIVSWQYLKTDDSMGEIDDLTPRTLKISPTNTQKIWTSVNLKKKQYQKYLQNYHLIYVPMVFLHQFHYQIGDTVDLRFKSWDYVPEAMTPETFLIAGTISTPELIDNPKELKFLLPYPLITKIWDFYNAKNGMNQIEQEADRPAVVQDDVCFNVVAQNKNVNQGQKVAATWFNDLFSNRKNPGELFQTSSEWSISDSAYEYELSQTLFLIIAYSIGFLTLGLLFIVFYFITQQIVVLQRQTLFFFKALGVKNSGLSLLTTLAMTPPLVIGLVIGFFGSLMIQQMMFGIALDGVTFYLGYWSFNFVYFVALFSIIFAAFLIFYLINLSLIRSKNLTIEGMSTLKDNARFFKIIKARFPKISPKFRIGLSFTFKNIYKNLIVYFILTVTFGIILFGVQFKSSLISSAHDYEKWSAPYKSVYYPENLKVFAPTKEVDSLGTDVYLPSYDQISTLDGLHPIKKFNEDLNDPEDLGWLISEYRKKLDGDASSQFTNWKDYYFDQAFVKEKLDLITDDPKAYDEFIKKVSDFIANQFPNSDEAILSVIDLIETMVEKYRQLRDDYHYQEGFNLLFGHAFLPVNNRSILSLSTENSGENTLTYSVLAFAPNDSETQKYFQLEKFATSKDFLVEKKYREYDPQTNQMVTKTGKVLVVNVSSYLASIKNIRVGDVIDLDISGLKSAKNVHSFSIHAYVNQIVPQDTVRVSIFTSQAGLIEYLVEATKRQINGLDPPIDSNLIKQKEVYENLLTRLNNQTDAFNLSNTAFDLTQDIPWNIRYLTLPIFYHTDSQQAVGSRIEDFYDEVELPRFFKEFGSLILIFKEITQHLLANGAPFKEMMQKFILILIFISFIISAVLIILILLENRRVILLFKAMGYQKSEINWYLISGYFVSTILATITAVILAYLLVNSTRNLITQYLSAGLYFIWNWQFILITLALVTAFCLAILVSIIIYTNLQKPRDAFVT